MAFLTLNSTTIRVKSNSADQKDNEHRVDRERMFDGTMRVFRGPIFRQWDITTAILDPTTYATVRALINSNSLPLSAAGDFIGGTVDVIPVPGSWTPVQSPGISGGFGWVGRFTLHENPTPAPVDTSAEPWAFFRRGHGFWLERSATTPAVDGDKVDRWDDQSGNGRYAYSHDGNGAGPDGTAWDGSLDYRPKRDTAQNALHFGWDSGAQTQLRVPHINTFTELEIMIGIRAAADPDANPNGIFALQDGGTSVDYYPDTDGHIKVAFGAGGTPTDCGDPAIDLTGFNCLDISADTVTRERIVRLNADALDTTTVLLADNFDWNSHTVGGDGPSIGLSSASTAWLRGWIRDLVIFDSILTDSQRLAWRNYILGVTSAPPIA